MIDRIGIENYKSIDELTFELGRFNVIIGENGCGKSNILEAICMGAAAAANKLDNEFLTSRGIRVTAPSYMRSAFQDHGRSEIKIEFGVSDISNKWVIDNDNEPYSSWKIKSRPEIEVFIKEYIDHVFFGKELRSEKSQEFYEKFKKEIPDEIKKNRLGFRFLVKYRF